MTAAGTGRKAVAILISGRGSNMAALIDAAATADYPARIALVISNRADAEGLAEAQAKGIPTQVIESKGKDRPAFDAELDALLKANDIEIVCLAGFMRLLTPQFVQGWTGRMINIHPSLLPAFKGLNVHQRVIEAGAKITGCTVHFVVPEMDDGPIIAQAAVAVPDGATADDVAAAVLAQEHVIYPAALSLLAEGRLTIEGQIVRIVSASPSASAPEVYCVNIPKDKLLAMPQADRCFLLLLGYCTNQISLFQKLIYFSTNNQPTNEIEEKLRAANTQLLVRHYVGIVHESLLLIQRRFLSSPLGQAYLPFLDQKGQAALGNLKKVLGSSQLISGIRNSYSFHYPTDEQLDQAFAMAAADAQWDGEWTWYFSHLGFNTFYFPSDIVTLYGLYGPEFKNDPVAGHTALMDQVGPIGFDILSFAEAFIAATWKQHFGSEMLADKIRYIEEAPFIDDIYIPFFVRIPQNT